MDIDLIWEGFINNLSNTNGIKSVHWKRVAGIPFLYVTADTVEKDELHIKIKMCAGQAMRGKRLHSETISVRTNGLNYVFRHRFYVPQEKMFCCGNLCPDCIRFE
ncbi:hypothetical protein [Jeotgalibacillus marinus]|uniref:Uncharacterized protein n=1 Tax=Jeotgalibacillus marinus TaxID=86667 RepID=A0ABV3Q238_9BACL